jgi:RNA polymerase sigma-70 factor (ECF subfamily)
VREIDDPAAFRTWLYSTVRNACLMKRRRRAGEPARFEAPVDVASPAPRPDERLVDTWIDRRLRAALASLPPAYRMIVVLREIEGLTTKEVATVSGISEANVKTRLHRAHRMLRKKLEDV